MKLTLLLMISTILLLSGCLKEDVSNIGGNISIQPEYAIPIGSPDLALGTYLNTLNQLNPIDTMQLDTLDGFLYDGELYQIPKRFNYLQNLSFTLSGATSTSEFITAAMFRTNAVNKIPAKIELQIYFNNAGGKVIDSLYENGPMIIEPAVLDSVGNVTATSEQWKYDTSFSDDRLQNLYNISSIDVSTEVIIESLDDVITKYYSDQDLWIQLGIKIKTNLKING